MFAGAGQLEGKGDHHSQQDTHVVVMSPAGADVAAQDISGNKNIVGEIDVQDLAQNDKTDTETGPCQIILRSGFPLNSAAKQIVQQENREKLASIRQLDHKSERRKNVLLRNKRYFRFRRRSYIIKM